MRLSRDCCRLRGDVELLRVCVSGLNRYAIQTPGDSLKGEAIQSVDPASAAHPLLAKLGRQGGAAAENVRSALVAALLTKEGWLIEKAYCAAKQAADPYPECSRDSLVESICSDYVLFGLAAGERHARELVKSVEAAAVAQAQGPSSPSR